MTTRTPAARARLWTILPFLLVAALFVFTAPWLRASFGPTIVTLGAAALAIAVMGYANLLAYRYQSSLDEVQRAGASFATQWGAPAGQFAFVMLMVLPPVRDLAISAVTSLAGASAADVDRDVVSLALILGFCGVVLLQTLGTLIVSALWFRSKQ